MTRTLLLLLVMFGLNAGEVGLPKPGTLDGVGVNIHFTHAKPGELEMLAAGGFRFVRMDFFWANIEREKGVYDFSAYEHLLTDLDRNGLRAYFILDYGNPLNDGGLSPHTDDGRAAFCAFVTAAMQRFAGRGIIWELWNEPNHGMFWKPVPKVDDYIALAQAVGETVREVAPKEILVGPTTSEIDLPFLEACFKAGLLPLWDAVSVHPYRQSPPETAAEEYRTLRQLIARHNLKRMMGAAVTYKGQPVWLPSKVLPILSGEWGYSSAKLPHGGFDEQQQASYLSRQWLTNIANEVPLSIWYDWHDDGDDRSNPEHNFGTVRRPYRAGQAEVYEPKPAYLAAKTLTTVLKGYVFSKALALKDDEHVLLFAKGDQLRLAAWTSAKETRLVAIPASVGRFRVTGHLGQDLPEILADANGLTLTLTNDVQYLAPIDANPSLRLATAWERLPLEVMVTDPQPGELVSRTDRLNNRLVIGPAPLIETVSMSFQNPLERSVHVDRDNVNVASGRGFTSYVVIPIGERASFSRPVSVPWDIDGRTVWTQTIRLVITNPVSISILAPHTSAGRAVVPVLVDNRLGTRFHAQFILTHHAGTSLVEHTCEAASEKVLLLPLAEKTDLPAQLAIVARHPQRDQPIRQLPMSTYRKLTSSPGDWHVVADGDAAVTATHTLAPGTASVVPGLDDLPTIDLNYRLERGWKFLRLVPRAPMGVGNARSIGMWIHGDGSGNVVRLRVIDASGQVFQPDGGRLTFTGWKWTTFTITAHTAHWDGANDGVAKPPLKLDTLLLIVQADQSKPSQGVVRIAGAMAVE